LHTSASHDCNVEPEQAYRRCRRLGLAPVFVTDHDTIDGALALKAAHPGDVVVGQEVSTTRGELIGLFLERKVEPGLNPEQAAKAIRKQGGVVYLQHPFDRHRRHLPIEVVEAIADLLDVVEVFNPRSDDEANQAAEDLRDSLGVPAGAGSDAHRISEIGAAYVEMGRFKDRDEFLARLKAGRVVRRPSRMRMLLEARLTPRPKAVAR
jgi:predicted metal-dependent phosphoesterase TrpH